MLGVVVNGVHVPLLHDLPLVHHRHPVADLIDHRQVMGDEQVGQAELGLQVHQQLEDLGLHGHVQSGHRLVQHNEAAAPDEGGGDGHPLALTAGELGGAAGIVLLPQAHLLQHVNGLGLPLLLVLHPQHPQGLLQKPAHRLGGVEGAVGVLEHHLRPEGVDLQGTLGVLHHPQQALGQGGFAGAGLSHNAQHLAGVQGEGDVAQHLLALLALSIVAVEALDVYHWFLSHGCHLLSVWFGWGERR